MNDDELLTKSGTCALLTLSPRTLDRLTTRGEIPSVKVGRARRWRKGSLMAWVVAKEHGPAAAVSPPPPAGAIRPTDLLRYSRCGHLSHAGAR